MKRVAKFGVLVWLAVAGCGGNGDEGAVGVIGDSYPLKDQGQPFNDDPGTDGARRAPFNSEAAPSARDECASTCGPSCGGFCQVLCLVCPNPDLGRCVSAGRGQENEDALCQAKIQTCLAQFGCPLDNAAIEQIQEDFE